MSLLVRSQSVLVWSVLMLGADLGGQAAEPAAAARDAVRNYVRQPDPAYSWQVVKQIPGNPSTMFIVQMTSQSWLTAAEVNRTLWQHWLVVHRPEKATSDTAFLLIGGGRNGGAPPEKPDATAARIAAATGSVVVELKMVPNQPLIFHNDGVERFEDDLIGYAWAQFLQSGDFQWLPRLPMVKSAVRAMDCVQELLASEQGGRHAIKRFVVAGGSKRGWTTWMTGAAGDPRVAAIVPIVIDVVNVEPSIKHHAAAYGFWAEAIGDYVQHGITKHWGDPRMDPIYHAVDPYFHRDRLTMPKFIVNAAGDQFFCPDSSQFYFADLAGEKLLRYVPNGDHSLRDTDAVESIAAFYQLVALNRPRPRYDWKFEADGAIRVTAHDPPREARLWQATNPRARDFRLRTIGKSFSSTPLTADNGQYVGRLDAPPTGWTAYFVELTYDVGLPVPLKVTTDVRIVPDTLPFANLDPNQVPYEGERGR